MDRRTFILSGTALVSALASPAQNPGSQLTVQVSYTGAGTVDESHKVYVALWDTADFISDTASAPPMALKAITSKSAAAQFDDIQKNPVYISMVYDPTGKWDAASAPPAGSSLGLYATEPGTPAPIQLQPGKPTKISAKFDDSFKMK